MASRYGMCPNIGNCSTANARKQIDMPADEHATCPECGRLLIAAARPSGGGSRVPLLAGAAAAVLVLLGGAGFLMLGAGGPQPAGPSPVVASATADASPPRPPAAAVTPASVPALPVPAEPSRAMAPAAPAPAVAAPAPAVAAPAETASPVAPATIAAALVAAAPPATAQRPAAEPPPAPVILHLSGSNTIGARLGPMLAEQFLIAEGYTIESRATPQLNEHVVTASRGGERVAVAVSAHGSSTAFRDLSAGKADIGMASRPVQDKEVQALADLGDMQSPANEHVLALDGIAVIINRANPVVSMTVKQIGDIFSGAVTDWSQVGGRAGPVGIYARDDNSGTFDTFKSLVLGKSALVAAAKRFEDSRELANAVASDPGGIGFVGLPYIGATKAVAVSEGGAEPLLPNTFTVATEDYPLARRLFLYTASVNPRPSVLNFTEFALSKAGQDFANEAGFVPLTVDATGTAAPASAPGEYRDLSKVGRRLSVNFRFRPNSSTLDNKAVRDLDRVVTYLQTINPADRGVVLIGFTDNSGARAANVQLSQQRSQTVADQLRLRGIQTQMVLGLGPELPVADNDTAAGRDKNRRVEIWVRPVRS